MDKDLAYRIWNAAIESATFELGVDINDPRIEVIKAPSDTFDEWWVRNVVDPPDNMIR